MKRRRSRWGPPPLPGGVRQTEPEIIELYPNPLPPPRPPATREEILACMQAGFAGLDDSELRVALLWLTGVTFDDACARLGMSEKAFQKAWQQMRRKLRAGVKGGD